MRIDTNHKINIYAATYYCQEESTSGNENNKQETAIEIAMNDGKFSVMTNINKKCSDDINVSPTLSHLFYLHWHHCSFQVALSNRTGCRHCDVTHEWKCISDIQTSKS